MKRPAYTIIFFDDKIKHDSIIAAERYYNYKLHTIYIAWRRGKDEINGRKFAVYDEHGNEIRHKAQPLKTSAEKGETRREVFERLKTYNDTRVDNLRCIACLTDLRVYADIMQANDYYGLGRNKKNISASITQECAVTAWKRTNPTRCNFIRPCASILTYLDVVYLWGGVETRIDGASITEKAVYVKDFYQKAKAILYSPKGLADDGEVEDLATGEKYADMQAVSDAYGIPYKIIWLALINGVPCITADDKIYYFALTNPKYEDYRDSILTQKKIIEKNIKIRK